MVIALVAVAIALVGMGLAFVFPVTFQSDASRLRDEISSQSEKISALELQQNESNQLLKKQDSIIDNMENQLNTSKATINSLQAHMANLESTLSSLQDRVASVEQRLGSNCLAPGGCAPPPITLSGDIPQGVAYDPAKGEIFVTNSGSNTLSVISESNNSIVDRIPVGSYPWGVAYDAERGEMFVANMHSDTVSVISDKTNSAVATIPAGSKPYHIAYDSSKGELFVTNLGSDTVSVISDVTNSVVDTVKLEGLQPQGIAYDPAMGEVFVGDYNSNLVEVISDTTNKAVTTIPVGENPQDMAYDPAQGELFVADYGPYPVGSYNGAFQVSVISDKTNSVVSTITVGTSPFGVAYDPATGEMFVTNANSNSISVIADSTNSVVYTIPISNPWSMAYDAAKGEMFVTSLRDNTVSVISDSSNTVVTIIHSNMAVPDAVDFYGVTGGQSISQERVYRQLPQVLPSDNWTANFDYKFTSSVTPSFFIFSLTGTSEDPELQPRKDVLFVEHGVWVDNLFVETASGASKGIAISPNIQYYVQLQRNPTQLVLSIFSNPQRTEQIAGSPVSLAINTTDYRNDLNYLQHDGSITTGSARSLTAELTNTKIYTRLPDGSQKTLFGDDYSSNSGWTQVGTQIVIHGPPPQETRLHAVPLP